MNRNTHDDRTRNASEWDNPPPFGFRAVLVFIIIFALMTFSAKNIELDKARVAVRRSWWLFDWHCRSVASYRGR